MVGAQLAAKLTLLAHREAGGVGARDEGGVRRTLTLLLTLTLTLTLALALTLTVTLTRRIMVWVRCRLFRCIVSQDIAFYPHPHPHPHPNPNPNPNPNIAFFEG